MHVRAEWYAGIISLNFSFIMACRAIPMIAFPRVQCMFIYIISIYNCPCNVRYGQRSSYTKETMATR